MFFGLLVRRISFFRSWGKILWYLWIGRARHPGPPSNNLDVEVFNVGGFLTHGDYVLVTDADFVAVVEHRLVSARARSEGKRLLLAGIRSVWAPSSLEREHVGHAGVGVVSLRGAPISLPSIATVGFSDFSSLVGFFGVICLSLVVVCVILLLCMAFREPRLILRS